MLVAGAMIVVALAATFVSTRRSTADAGPSPSEIAADRPCAEADPTPPIPKLPPGSLELRSVATVEEPTSAIFAPDQSGDGLLGLRDGRVLRIEAGRVTGDIVLDLRDDTMQEGDGGLLAMAYDPSHHWLYVYRADAARDDLVTAHPLDDAGRPDADAKRLILAVDHPDSLQHHGGAMVVGPDQLLYVGFGDGGGLGDPQDNAQDPSTLLGKVVRIAPTPDDTDPYRIPPDNPFVDRRGWAPEIWLLGVRNPFRMSLDAATGDLWLGDVGHSCWEELDRLPTGADSAGGSNLGWDHLEGTHVFEGGEVPGRELKPAEEQAHADRWCVIVAGYVPRGSTLPELDGRLLYTDYCLGRVLALATGARGTEPRLVDTGLHAPRPIAIVPGPGREPWVLTLDGVLAIVDGAG
jgi:hypothetical protein